MDETQTKLLVVAGSPRRDGNTDLLEVYEAVKRLARLD